MRARDLVLAALVLACVCAAVMYWLEDFRSRRWLAELRAELDRLPTFQPEGGNT